MNKKMFLWIGPVIGGALAWGLSGDWKLGLALFVALGLGALVVNKIRK